MIELSVKIEWLMENAAFNDLQP